MIKIKIKNNNNNNKPTGCSIVHDKKEKTWLMTDVAISDDSNFNTKETEELK
jgi:hypothetical protein